MKKEFTLCFDFHVFEQQDFKNRFVNAQKVGPLLLLFGPNLKEK